MLGSVPRGHDVPFAAALEEANEMLDRVQAWGGVGFWSLDLETLEPYWSTQVFEILGVESGSLDDFLDRVHADDRALVGHVAIRAREQPGPYRVVHRYMRGDELRTLTHHMQSVPGPDGRPERLLGVVSDTTALSVLQAQIGAAASAHNMGLVAGLLVHTFKNQLAIVAGHAQLAVNAVDRRELPDRDGLLAIQRAATKGTDLARQILELGRPTAAEPHRVDVRPVLERLAGLAGPLIGAANRVVLHVQDGAPPVLADGQRLEQVLVDLVINAADALPRSGGELRLGYEEVVVGPDESCDALAPGRYGALTVEDDGAGMDAATLGRATEPFFTTKGSDRGSGIGLSSAATFADDLGGQLQIRSTPGVGTEVRLLLPVAPAPSTPTRAKAVRVVVVSQERSAAEAAVAHLAGHEVQAVAAASWEEVDRFVLTEPIDAVVVDGQLPDPLPVRLPIPTAVTIDLAGTDGTALLHALRGVLDGAGRPRSSGHVGEPGTDPVEA